MLDEVVVILLKVAKMSLWRAVSAAARVACKLAKEPDVGGIAVGGPDGGWFKKWWPERAAARDAISVAELKLGSRDGYSIRTAAEAAAAAAWC